MQKAAYTDPMSPWLHAGRHTIGLQACCINISMSRTEAFKLHSGVMYVHAAYCHVHA